MTVSWRKISVYLWRIILTTVVVLVAYEQFFSRPNTFFDPTGIQSNNQTTPSFRKPALQSLAPVLEGVIPAVVNITTVGQQSDDNADIDSPGYVMDSPDGSDSREFRNLGSGVIIDAERGYVITNFHVVENAQQINVVLNDERQVSGRLLGSDPDTDVALIKIDADELTELPFASNPDLAVGDFVIAVGNPFGLRHSVSLGIVSALGRYGISENGTGIQDYIQTDAPINPGNSGGALINMDGQLVGINTAIYSNSGTNAGIGFAIPSGKLTDITEQLLMYGSIRRSIFGVVTEPLNEPLRLQFGLLDAEAGMVVTQVSPDSLADRTGIRPGDIIERINGTTIDSQQTLRNTTGLLLAGQPFTIEVSRANQLLSFQTRFPPPRPTRSAGDFMHPKLAGAEFRDLPLAEQVGPASGVLVHSVRASTPAWHANLRPGDVIIQVNGTFINSLLSFQQTLREAGSQLQLLVQSGQRVYDVTIR